MFFFHFSSKSFFFFCWSTGSAKSSQEGAAFFKQRTQLAALETRARADQDKIAKLEAQLAWERGELHRQEVEFMEKLRAKQRDVEAVVEERDLAVKKVEKEHGARARETLDNEVKRLKDKLDRELVLYLRLTFFFSIHFQSFNP